MIQFKHANDPNPARLIESLRHVGYGNYEAIADLVDNCIDAEATQIHITVRKQREDFEIVIADNGIGMDQETLDQAMRLGSLTQRDPATDLGKFGMGLVTASHSMSRRTEVITKSGDVYLTAINDIDEIVKANRFLNHLGESTPSDIALFNDLLADASSGSVVRLTKTDSLQNRNTTHFANTLRRHLGQVHRFFLMVGMHGMQITVNGEVVEPIDPLMADHKETEIFSDDLYPIEIETSSGRTTENIRVRIALIPEDVSAGDLALAKSLQHQGFYGLRNNRQIFAAQTLGFFSKHNDFNRMRGEIFFSAKFDEVINIEFTKRQVVFSQAMQDKLGEHLRAQCTTIKRREAGRGVERTTAEHQRYHEQASKTITEKSRLLITPKAEIEKRGPRGKNGRRKTAESNGLSVTRTQFKKSQRVESDLRCRFVSQRLGPNGQIFECDLEGRTIIIRWNIEHPFYRRFVVENRDDGRLVTAVDFLVYSMACAELMTRNDDNAGFIANMKAITSANLKTLLS